jgi:hypothetical protein
VICAGAGLNHGAADLALLGAALLLSTEGFEESVT